MTLRDHYARIRADHPTIGAMRALQWARWEVRIDLFLSEHGWDNPNSREWPVNAPNNLVLSKTFPAGSIRVYWDPEPYDWGDIEPTEEEREALEVIGIEVLDSNGEHLDSCWSYGFNGRTSDIEREAASFALDVDAIGTIVKEASEVAYWSARDVPTVDA